MFSENSKDWAALCVGTCYMVDLPISMYLGAVWPAKPGNSHKVGAMCPSETGLLGRRLFFSRTRGRTGAKKGGVFGAGLSRRTAKTNHHLYKPRAVKPQKPGVGIDDIGFAKKVSSDPRREWQNRPSRKRKKEVQPASTKNPSTRAQPRAVPPARWKSCRPHHQARL